MWIYTQNGFASAVQKGRNGPITVRTRSRADAVILSKFAPGEVKVKSTPNRDYQYRFVLSVEDFGAFMANLAFDVDYPNFKERIHDTLTADDNEVYTRVYYETWDLKDPNPRSMARFPKTS